MRNPGIWASPFRSALLCGLLALTGACGSDSSAASWPTPIAAVRAADQALTKGDWELAEAAASFALSQNPGSALALRARLDLGHALAGNDQVDQAAAEFARALEGPPPAPADDHAKLVSIWLELGRLPEAEQALRTASETFPDQGQRWRRLERSLQDRRQPPPDPALKTTGYTGGDDDLDEEDAAPDR